MAEIVHSVVLLVDNQQPAGVEGLLAEQDYTGWTWEVAGGPFCLVTAPDGAKWAFVPDEGDGYWDRITDSVHGARATLLGQIRPIANLYEWQGLACHAQELEQIRLRAIVATSMGAGSTRINATIKVCLDAAQAAYDAILRGSCPALAASDKLAYPNGGGNAVHGAGFLGDANGRVNGTGPLAWRCHRPIDHIGSCDASLAAADRCCVPGVLPDAADSVSPPYERGWFWDYLPVLAADLVM